MGAESRPLNESWARGRSRDRATEAAWTGLRRTVLGEVATAAACGRSALLRQLGVQFQTARALAALDPVTFESLASSRACEAVRISVDDELLASLISGPAAIAENRQLAIDLLEAGGTRGMVSEFGLAHGESTINSVMCVARGGKISVGGRPAPLSDREVRACHSLWGLRADPSLVHPVRHLIQTARHLGLPAVSIWMSLTDNEDRQATAAGRRWSDRYPWVFVMFPNWSVEGEGRRCACA